MLGVPRQYLSVTLILSYKLDFSCCANMNGFPRPSHIYLLYSTMTFVNEMCADACTVQCYLYSFPLKFNESLTFSDTASTYTYMLQTYRTWKIFGGENFW